MSTIEQQIRDEVRGIMIRDWHVATIAGRAVPGMYVPSPSDDLEVEGQTPTFVVDVMVSVNVGDIVSSIRVTKTETVGPFEIVEVERGRALKTCRLIEVAS